MIRKMLILRMTDFFILATEIHILSFSVDGMQNIYAFAMIERVPASGGTFLLDNAVIVIRVVKNLFSLT